jgi:pyridoxal phosphate enzyme (YggS family)
MSISQNLTEINQRIKVVAQAAGRDPKEVRLIAVSKIKPAKAVQEALEAGQILFGENYVQEAAEKTEEVSPTHAAAPVWHLIGHLQSNKAKLAAKVFDAVQTIDRVKLAKSLDRHAGDLGKTLEVLLQVNVGGEAQKSGCAPADALVLAQAVAQMPNLKLKGLMTMPTFFDDPERARPLFAKLRELSQKLQAELPAGSMQELSMGMSGDFEAAIKEGATLVRVGTAIFGERVYS